MRRFVLGTFGAGLLTLALVVPTTAAPTRAPGASVGTADCGSQGKFTFTVAGGNGMGMGTSWRPAFVLKGTSRGLFIPTAIHLSFSSPQGPFSLDAVKSHVAGAVTCSISGHAVNAPVTFTGTATGNLVIVGH